jgi:F420-dependent oxidoreductase-like protein
MRFSIWPNLAQPWTDIVDEALHAEATGWDGVYVADHFMGDAGGFGPVESPMLEATAALAGLALATDRVRLGSLVFGGTYRHPAVLANWAATVDRMSGGRLVLGVGAGWQENEHAQYGIELPPVGDRVSRLEELCAVLNQLLRQERSTFDGRWFQLDEAVCEPKPVQQPLPLLIGGKGDRMLAITARYADEWNMWSLPETIAERGGALDRCCEKIGRDPAEIKRSTQALVYFTDDAAAAARFVETVAPRAAIAGGSAQVAEVVEGWRAAGVDEVIVPDFVLGHGAARAERMDRIIEEVAPAFRSRHAS